MRHPKKTIDWVGPTLAEKRCFISALQQEHSVREICGILGVNRSSFYSQPEEDPSEAVLRAEVEISVARRGRPWENGYAERLIRTLKAEEVHLNDSESLTEARDHIGHFITQVYHQKRPHSALGYLTPLEFEQQPLS